MTKSNTINGPTHLKKGDTFITLVCKPVKDRFYEIKVIAKEDMTISVEQELQLALDILETFNIPKNLQDKFSIHAYWNCRRTK